MKFLLDTHVLLWWLFDSPQLSANLRSIVAERSHEILVSSASAWEIATKFRIGKLPEASSLIQDYSGWLTRAGFLTLNVTAEHALRAGLLTHSHRDPFDRMLAAQSAVENVPLCSADPIFESFGIHTFQ
jgi:PIN domain nuclease of toxin-antitoxin system